jgi:eukaryotic-like serine/threonine-protein kinase
MCNDIRERAMTFSIGRYEVVEKLGSGGMAHVFLARDPYMKRQVAIKVMSAAMTTDPEFRTRFETEAEVIAALEHPFIVPVYDFGYYKEQPYLVMRYLMGGSLKERLEDYGPMAISDAAKILERMAAALDEAHRRGVVHRDVKPENVLLDTAGDTFLADFGIVKIMSAAGSGTAGQWITGTPAYMAPEQVYGDRPITPATDVYALGVTLYELLTTTKPYTDSNNTKLMMNHVMEPVPQITMVLPDAPAGIEEVIMKAMAKEPADRYQSAGEFSEAVNSAGRAILSKRARKRWMADEITDALSALEDDEDDKPVPNTGS